MSHKAVGQYALSVTVAEFHSFSFTVQKKVGEIKTVIKHINMWN
jgi:hypothetical protein